MTRYQTAIGLLKLGPLTKSEFVEITGWPRYACDSVLAQLVERKEIQRIRRGVYQIHP